MLGSTLTGCISPGPKNAGPTSGVPACTVDRVHAHERLFGALWVQTSADYAIAALRAFRQAKEQLDIALADDTRTAALEQQPPYTNKSPAVILDIDETVLDNSPFQAQLVLDGTDYLPATWTEWVAVADANWVPGALDFVSYAASKNVAVVFVSNRTKDEETNTRKNFQKLGYGVSTVPDHMLTKDEMTGWTSDKTSRRAFVT